MSARELFSAARAASDDAEYLKRRIERMKASEGVRGASLAPSARSSKVDINGMTRTNARIDFEAATRDRMESDYALIDYTCAVLYGEDGRAGLAALLGSKTAELLWFYYLDHESMDDAAQIVGISRRSAFRVRDRALDLVDMWGFELTMAGEGGAT